MKGNFPSELAGTADTDIFRVVDISGEPQHKNILITYQVIGKSTTTTEKASLLIKDLMALKGFLKQDAELIYNLAIAEKTSPEFRVISILFNDEPIKFEIEEVNSKYTLLLTSDEIISTKSMLSNFSANDISMIYFQLMKECQLKNSKDQPLRKPSAILQNKIYLVSNQGMHE